MRLLDKVAIVTGASSGIGKATALRFAQEGAKVVITARRKEKLDEVVELAKDFEGEIFSVAGDLSVQDDIDGVVREALDKYGRIDILINNAGIIDKYQSSDDIEDDIWDRVLEINLTGPLKMTRSVLPTMKKQKSGSIVNTASVAGLFGGRGGIAYVAAKHGLVGMTKHIAVSFKDYNIRANAVAPAGVDTAIGVIEEPYNSEVLERIV